MFRAPGRSTPTPPRSLKAPLLSALGIAVLALPGATPAQEIPAGVARETMIVDRPAMGEWPGGGWDAPGEGGPTLNVGERIAVWVRGGARAGNPDAAGGGGSAGLHAASSRISAADITAFFDIVQPFVPPSDSSNRLRRCTNAPGSGN